jgi:hypothetical protein
VDLNERQVSGSVDLWGHFGVDFRPFLDENGSKMAK